MVTYKRGDILSEDAEALVNTVNCVGVMGRGIALQFKKAFPENFRAYESACKRGEVQPGSMFVVETEGLTNPRYIVNFPTKRHWRGKSRIEDIESGLRALTDEIQLRKIESIAIPPLGTGLGGLPWPEVKQRIEDALTELPNVRVVVFEPGGGPSDDRPNRTSEVPPMTPGRAALVSLMDRYLRGLLDPFVTLLEVHKLMYFLQEAGEPLRLRYEKGPFGPYAENLRHVLNAIDGHLVSGYDDGRDDPKKQLELVPGALRDASEYLEGATATLERMERVSDLVEGFESPFGLELLSTVHWILGHQGIRDTDELAAAVHAWDPRKRQFSERQIELARNTLVEQGWAAG